MRSKLLDTTENRRTLVVVFDTGDEVAGCLLDLAREQRLQGSHFTAIGALQDVVLGYWQWETKKYKHIPIREQMEVVSLEGNIALASDGTPKLHAHIVVAKSDGTAHGGHLVEAHVRPTLELVITESPRHLQRRHDEATGLALLEP
jgi:predicted DNA-binding protein with PD1-like motif